LLNNKTVCFTVVRNLRFPNNNHKNDSLIQMLHIIMDSLPNVDENKAGRQSPTETQLSIHAARVFLFLAVLLSICRTIG